MQPSITLQYSEFKVADELSSLIKGISVFAPASGQEKGIDLLLFKRNGSGNRTLTIQVKSSRTYYGRKSEAFRYYLTVNRFVPQENADLIMLTGIYPDIQLSDEAVNANNIEWEPVTLVFTYEEMNSLLNGAELKPDGEEPDNKLAFGFNNHREIYFTRGKPDMEEASGYLLKNRLDIINGMLEQGRVYAEIR
jgi:hypothetical protein